MWQKEKTEYQICLCISFITSLVFCPRDGTIAGLQDLIWYSINFQATHVCPWKSLSSLLINLRFHVEQNLHLEKLKLRYSDPKLDSKVDQRIQLAVKLNVTVLMIYPSFIKSYSLPNVIYDAKKLKTLSLSRCKFEFDISTTHIRFCCLKELYLFFAHISDAQL